MKSRQNGLGNVAWYARWFCRLQNWWRLKCLQNRLGAIPYENDYVGPIPVLSTALNLVEGGELAWRERMAESFTFTPFYCGSLTTGYAPTQAYAGGITVAQAVSISGAAVSPNMGYHSYRPVSALLTIFNLRLGAWLGNPRFRAWKNVGPQNLLKYLKNELLGLTNADQNFVYLSDGGHFDNLGLYELIRRRCRYIVACDSGADPDFTFADLASVIRKVRVDFGIQIEINTQKITPEAASGSCACHVAIGRICYGEVDCAAACRPEPPSAESESEPSRFRPECNEGILIYIKPSLTGDEPQDVLNYRAANPLFPHQSTTNQWFSESQFESYRALGWHIARTVFTPARGNRPEEDRGTRDLFQELFDRWSPAARRNWKGHKTPIGTASRAKPFPALRTRPSAERCFAAFGLGTQHNEKDRKGPSRHRGDFPAFAIVSGEPVVGFGEVGDLHVLGVPGELLRAVADGDVP